MRKLQLFICLCCLGMFLPLSAQVTISLLDKSKTYEGQPSEARIDFISEANDLLISEYKGTPINPPQSLEDGRYVYTCVCNVEDDNQFTFEIKKKGEISSSRQPVFIKEGQYFEYAVEVESRKMAIEEVKMLEETIVVPESNTAKVFITTSFDQLLVSSKTGEPVSKPEKGSDGLWKYTIAYNMSTPESREIERGILLATSPKEESVEFSVGKLQPKEGKNVVVIVMEENCFDYNVRIAKKFQAECNYRESFLSYKEAFKCESKPEDTQNEYEQMRKVNGLAKLQILEQKYWTLASDPSTPLDSVMGYYKKSKIYRKEILEHSPNDMICHSHENAEKELPRIVSGTVRHKSEMDGQGNKRPIKDARVIIRAFERKFSKEGGIKLGKEYKEKTQVFRTNQQGKFTVPVPRNTDLIVYQLRFTLGLVKESGEGKGKGTTDEFDYMPTDADWQEIGTVLLAPDSNFFGYGGVNK